MDLISVNLFQVLITDQNIVDKIVPLFFGAVLDQIDQLSSADHINSG